MVVIQDADIGTSFQCEPLIEHICFKDLVDITACGVNRDYRGQAARHSSTNLSQRLFSVFASVQFKSDAQVLVVRIYYCANRNRKDVFEHICTHLCP